MPTINPRVQVTLPPALDLLVQRMATLQRVSKSQVLRELLEAAEPALQRAVALMDAAQQAAQSVHTGLAQRLDQEQQRAEKSLAQLLGGLDATTADLVAQAEAVKGRRPARKPSRPVPAAARGAPNPPASNRGVNSTTSRAKKGAHRPGVKGGRA